MRAISFILKTDLPQIIFSRSILFIVYSVTAAAAVVLIATAVIGVLIAASVVACENKNKDDEKNPVTVASVTKEHLPDLLSHLSIP